MHSSKVGISVAGMEKGHIPHSAPTWKDEFICFTSTIQSLLLPQGEIIWQAVLEINFFIYLFCQMTICYVRTTHQTGSLEIWILTSNVKFVGKYFTCIPLPLRNNRWGYVVSLSSRLNIKVKTLSFDSPHLTLTKSWKTWNWLLKRNKPKSWIK